MYKHLLVPLDGSRLAESVIPAAVYLAGKLGSSLTLIHVIEQDAPETIHGQRHLNNSGEAEKYLQELIKTRFPADYKISYHVHEDKVSNVAQSLVEHSGELHPDLIIMCSHGRGGVRDLLFGSIAQKVIALGKTPLMLIQPDEDNNENTFECRTMLIPVDGNQEHERGLYAAEEIAKACDSRIHLLMAVPVFGNLSGEWTSSSKFLPGTTTRMLEMLADNAEDYLSDLKKDLISKKIKATSETNRDDPEDAIIKSSSSINADVIVLGTHGKTGLDAFWSGSVTARICRQVHKPILLVPIKK